MRVQIEHVQDQQVHVDDFKRILSGKLMDMPIGGQQLAFRKIAQKVICSHVVFTQKDKGRTKRPYCVDALLLEGFGKRFVENRTCRV